MESWHSSGARREHCSRNRQLEVKARADTTFADEELSRRLEESPGCSSTATDLEGGILEVLLKELNEKGRLYRESGYMFNAVEKPEELRVNAAEPGLVHCLPLSQAAVLPVQCCSMLLQMRVSAQVRHLLQLSVQASWALHPQNAMKVL